MYAWEREALGIDTLGEIQGSVTTRMRIELGGTSRAAWWIATLFGPDFWTHWRVGLLRPTLFGMTEGPVAPPPQLILELPAYLAQRAARLDEALDYIAVCPAVLESKALAFAVIGATTDEVSSGRVEPADRWTLVAPSDLVERLGLAEGSELQVRLLPASYRADPPRGH